MYYSYVMGIGDDIYSLEEKGFAIERFYHTLFRG